MATCIRRAAFPNDAQATRALFRQYQQQLGFDLCFQGFEEELRDLPGAYAEPAGAVWLALSDDQPAGCIAIRPLAADIAEIKRMFVQPSLRGTGAGIALAQAAIDYARVQGYATVVLDTLQRMQPAIALYRKLGFADCERYNDNPMPDVLFMRLGLRSVQA